MSSAQADYSPWSDVERLLAELHVSYAETEDFLAREFDSLLQNCQEYGAALAAPCAVPAPRPAVAMEPLRGEVVVETTPAALHAELAELRESAAALADLLDQQRELTLQQQAEWSEEHRALRGLIKNVSRRSSKTVVELSVNPVAAMPPAAPAAPPARPRRPPRDVRPVLDSLGGSAASESPSADAVLSQFERFQRESTRRRAR